MNCPGDNFLAGSALAAHQHGRVALGHALDGGANLVHHSAASHQRPWQVHFRHRPQGLIFQAQTIVLEGSFDEVLDLFTVERFLNVIVSPQFHRLDGRAHSREGRHENDRHLRPNLASFGQQFGATHLGHF